jgi:hypothetical protein
MKYRKLRIAWSLTWRFFGHLDGSHYRICSTFHTNRSLLLLLRPGDRLSSLLQLVGQ